jgi:hypothetical protein
MTDNKNEQQSAEETQERAKSVQIAADALIKVKIYRYLPNESEPPVLLEEFEHSRNVLSLLPKLQKALEKYPDQIEDLRVVGTLEGKDPDTGQNAELDLYNHTAAQMLTILRMRAITPDEAMVASRGFFGDMLDVSDAKAILLTAVFGEGQASYVMMNKTVEVVPEHMFRLIATTLMQLDKFKQQMIELGIKLPGDNGGIITPGQPGFGVNATKL